MDLVLVEFMVLSGYVLDNPFFHRSLRGHDRWRIVVVEQRWLLARAHLGNEELGRLNLAELERTRGRHGLAAQSAKSLVADGYPSVGADAIIGGRCGRLGVP